MGPATRRRPEPGERDLGVEGADAPGVPLVMQRRAVLHQAGPPVDHRPLDTGRIRVLRVPGPVQCSAQLLGEPARVKWTPDEEGFMFVKVSRP